MAFKTMMFLLVALCVATIDGYRGAFAGAGFPFSPMAFVSSHVPLPWDDDLIMPKMKFPKIPGKEEILNSKGKNYQGVFISVPGDGDAELIYNKHGKVYQGKIPPTVKNDPEILAPTINTGRRHFRNFDGFSVPLFENMFEAIDPTSLKHRVPSSPNEKFEGVAVVSSSQSSNNNGVVTSSGGIHSVSSKGGNVKESVITF